MILSMARNIPQAHVSLSHGEWDRKTFRGTELYQKRSVSLVPVVSVQVSQNVYKALGCAFLAYDPYLSEEKRKS